MKFFRGEKKINIYKKVDNKNQTATRLKNSNCDITKKNKLGQNSKTQIVTKLNNSNCDKTQNSNWDKTLKLKF